MGSLFGGGGNSQPQKSERTPKGIRVISQFGERMPMTGGATNVMGRLWRMTPNGPENLGPYTGQTLGAGGAN